MRYLSFFVLCVALNACTKLLLIDFVNQSVTAIKVCSSEEVKPDCVNLLPGAKGRVKWFHGDFVIERPGCVGHYKAVVPEPFETYTEKPKGLITAVIASDWRLLVVPIGVAPDAIEGKVQPPGFPLVGAWAGFSCP